MSKQKLWLTLPTLAEQMTKHSNVNLSVSATLCLFLSGDEARSWLERDLDRLHSIPPTEIGATMSDGGKLLKDQREMLKPRHWRLLTRTYFSRKEG